jgi:hypothetical protein
MSLYEHQEHPHQPVNVNEQHAASQTGFNTKIAVFLTRTVGTMTTAYAFVVLALIGLCAILGWLNPVVVLLVSWLSQTLIQLVLLPVIMVAQNVLDQKQALQSDEQFNMTEKMYHISNEQNNHMHAQDTAIINLQEQMNVLTEKMDTLIAQNQKPIRKRVKVDTGGAA